ncbi:MAG TPA: glycosyltransferase family 4 protein, partial [Nocardioides sp.]|nr:glycosyltransferase family 4 protein [Nocardioides sp.]
MWFGAAAPLGLMAATLKKEAGVRRTVATTHGHEVWWARAPITRQMLHRIGETNDVLTYVAEYTRERIAKSLSPDAAAKMVRLTPGVDTDLFNPSVDGRPVREMYGLGDRPVIVCVSRFVERKGQDMLIRALSLVQREVPDAALLLVGDGPMRKRLVRLADELDVSKDVIFVGPKPWRETPPYYAAGDVFCMPCRTRKFGFEVEALGIVFLEAAATGLPVITGDSGGAPDTVRQEVTGVVVRPEPAQVAEAVLSELVPETRRRHGAAGRQLVVERFDWSR